MKTGFVYILASKKNGTLYIGMTSDLLKRIYEHKNDMVDGFTRKYQLHQLVYYEVIPDMENVIKREKQLKKFNRYKKVMLIEEKNPEWRDLYDEIKR